MTEPASPEQQRYQLRFDWGRAGIAAIASDVDVVVWVDAIPSDNATIPIDAIPSRTAVVEGSFSHAAAVSAWLVDLQQLLSRRIVIAVIGAGVVRPDGSMRFTVEDLLASGAIIDRLAAAGLDTTSPEAAAAEAAYRQLARAVRHLVSASVSAETNPPTRDSLRADESLDAGAVIVLRDHPGR